MIAYEAAIKADVEGLMLVSAGRLRGRNCRRCLMERVMAKINVYPPGKILLLSEGEYSDYGYAGQLVTLKECDLAALAADFVAQWSGESWRFDGASNFIAWLVAQQYCAPLECEEVHVGSYGRLQIGGVIYKPKPKPKDDDNDQ